MPTNINFCAVFVVCVVVLNRIQAQLVQNSFTQHFLPPRPPTLQPEISQYQTLDFFPSELPAKIAFTKLLAPMETSMFPPNLIQLKRKLIYLIMTNKLQVAPIMNYISQFRNLNQGELMTKALIALHDTLPEGCLVQRDLIQLIEYPVYQGCSQKTDNFDLSFKFDPILLPRPQPAPVPPPPSEKSCNNIVNVLNEIQTMLRQCNCQFCSLCIDAILNKLSLYIRNFNDQTLMRGDSFLTSADTLKPSYTITPQILPFEQLISILPLPKTPEETLKYDAIVSFIKSGKINNYFKNFNSGGFDDTLKLFHVVVQTIIQSNVELGVKEAFNYYIKIFNENNIRQTYDYLSLMDLLPQPIDSEEKEKYEIVKTFLSRKDFYTFLNEIDVSIYEDKRLLLKTILQIMASSTLEVKIVEAFRFYLNYQENLTELELFTKKEIKRHFKLTEIFQDTLDVNSLSNDNQLAFRKFFKFISNITGDQIKSFDTWSEVATRGEFMKALFKYLLTQEFVPVDIKQAIAILEPIINMGGKGAAPP